MIKKKSFWIRGKLIRGDVRTQTGAENNLQ